MSRSSQRLLASIRSLASSSSSPVQRSAPAVSAAIYSRTSFHSSAASSASNLAKPEFSCVDANERRGQKLQRLAEQAKATSCSAARNEPPVAFPCVDANEAREDRLRAQLSSPQLSEDPSTSQNEVDESGPEPSYTKVVSGYQLYHHSQPFRLDYGGGLPEFDLAYETWGELNADKSNAILLHTGLSASSHAASTPSNPAKGWWEDFVGPNKPLDTNRFFVICTNVLGGCYGSTGPSSPHPLDPTKAAYATRFPILSIFDMVRAQFLLLDHLGIGKLYASVGSSMGGMQSIAAAHLERDRVGKVVSISGCARSAPASIALRYAQRSVLMSDPNWNRGFYYDQGSLPPHTGMKLARQIATFTYRSGPEWEQRFGRARRVAPSSEGKEEEELDPALCPDFLIETYLDHQGEAFCLKYDANSLIYISKAMDLFDMSDHALADLERRRTRAHGPSSTPLSVSNTHVPAPRPRKRQHISTLSSPAAHAYVPALARGMARLSDIPTLVIGVQSDILFPVEQQREIAECLRLNGNDAVRYYELDAPHGHDSFLIDVPNVGGAIRGFLE
ncbi:Alpha/beta hydrolase fold-1 [Kalmanozyma brasiliensis GHG001]|uniref:Alpha/beta hydrolase fold-1 n=1 Tax=Kalmanozyma brasiliensis (strain GHG001) TaxID=1365824 RepID=UPI001CE7CCAE|nr:Alpha/beta hydrolase fold-1 [Kalmanozyma brasiliensis GHG001]EST07342.2 Alpha/beta hydrolase fold-1 [Kalmanozyma brasiliensis GHG001]